MYRKSVLEEVGGHNPEFIKSQDSDINYRIRQKGYKLLRNPKAIQTYYPRELRAGGKYGIKEFAKQIFWYGFAKAFFLKKHPRAIKEQLRTLAPLVLLLGFPIWLSIYLVLTSVFAFQVLWRTGNLAIGLTSYIMFYVEHLSYGAGYLYALLGGKFNV